jgi:hypothetical protein
MKNFIRGLLLSTLILIGITSCVKTDEGNQSKVSEVSFNLDGLPSASLSKKGTTDFVATNVSDYPNCSEENVGHVELVIDGVEYSVGMTSLESSQTEVIKLESGTYVLESLEVYDINDELIYVMPSNTSIEVTEAGLSGVPKPLVIKDWEKKKVDVDVVCWH